MSEPNDAVQALLLESRRLKHATEQNANTLAELLVPSLRSVSDRYLRRLKKALRNYNMNTGKWDENS